MTARQPLPDDPTLPVRQSSPPGEAHEAGRTEVAEPMELAEPLEPADAAEAAEGPLEPDPDLSRIRPGLLRGAPERLFLLLLMAAGMTSAWVGHLEGRELLPYLGSFLVTFGGLSLLVRLPSETLNRKVQAFVADWVDDLGKGYYSVVALSVFLWWEALLLLEGVEEILAGDRGVVPSIIEAFLGFGLESLFNVFMAMAWPLFLFGHLELEGVLLLAAGAWFILRVGSFLVSTPAWMVEEET